MYIDSVINGYYNYAYVFGGVITRVIAGVATALVMVLRGASGREYARTARCDSGPYRAVKITSKKRNAVLKAAFLFFE